MLNRNELEYSPWWSALPWEVIAQWKLHIICVCTCHPSLLETQPVRCSDTWAEFHPANKQGYSTWDWLNNSAIISLLRLKSKYILWNEETVQKHVSSIPTSQVLQSDIAKRSNKSQCIHIIHFTLDILENTQWHHNQCSDLSRHFEKKWMKEGR